MRDHESAGSVGHDVGPSIGSCVLIGAHGHVATAWHVVESHRRRKKKSHLHASVSAIFPNGSWLSDFTIIGTSDSFDVCIMLGQKQSKEPLPNPMFSGGGVRRGETVVMQSYPLVIDENIVGANIREPACFVGHECHSGNGEHAASYLGFPNSSGGPVFDLDGKLCGIHTGTVSPGVVPYGDVMVADLWREYLDSNSEVSVYTDMNVVMALIPNNAPLTMRAQRQARSRRASAGGTGGG